MRMSQITDVEMEHQKRQKPAMHNICAVVVTYHPDMDLPKRVESISRQVDKVVIVDNHSSPACLDMLKKISLDLGVHLILNEENLGIATALNQGARHAIDFGEVYSWFLTLDQDTLLFPNMVQNLISAYNDCPFNEQVGIIGSNYQEWTTGRVLFQSQEENQIWAEVENLPTSGCLTSIPIFKDVGNFRDDFFIDYVDTEYCLKLRERGYRVIISPRLGMKHPLGYYKPSKLYNFLFNSPMVTNYPPIRHYYWTRNGLTLIREQLRKDMKWSFNELYYLLIRRLVTVLLFEENKFLKVKYITFAVFDACLSKRNKQRDFN